ncbi:MAG: excinuclease ABC subunit UvrC [Salibacteraceae bacterium]
MITPNEILEEKIGRLPHAPGVYQFYDKNGKLIYVGKAKDLRKRVASYFVKSRQHTGKTALLIKNIADVNHIVANNEYDALLLENSMIKEHQPRFNIQLRDDKTYPWICIKNERFPRVFATRVVVRDGSEYYGPYASVRQMKTLLNLITRMHKVRTCNYNLSEENIHKGKFKVCLEYHLGNCLGPCEGHQSEEDYNQAIADIRKLVKGDVDELITDLETRMKTAAAELQFESAAGYKEQIDLLSDYQSRSVVVNPSVRNVDVASIIADDAFAYLNYMRVVKGAVIQSHSIEIRKKLDEPSEELILNFIAEMRNLFNSNASEIIVSEPVYADWEGITFHYPKRGNKKALVDFSLRNVRMFMFERQKAQEKTDPERYRNRVLSTLQRDLKLKELPVHIECFDNSNFQGSYPVAACVVFKNARPSKQDYRHFNIKTVEGPNDFASMEEVIYRRYKRMMDENQSLPQLIVIDGGKGQLSAAVKSLEKLGLRGRIAVIGIAKRLEEIYFPNDSVPLYIDKRSESLKLIQRMRNEAHRFGITHHRNKRSKNTFRSELMEIPGVGVKTARELLRNFGSVDRVKNASLEQLQEVVSEHQARSILRYFTK